MPLRRHGIRARISESDGHTTCVGGIIGGRITTRNRRWRILLGRFNYFVVEEVERGAKDNPLDTIFISFAKSLPYSLFFWSLASDTDSSASTPRTWRILLNLAKLDPLRGDVMTGISKIKHAPKCSIRIRLGYLKQWKVGGIGGRQREFIDGGYHTRVGNGPF